MRQTAEDTKLTLVVGGQDAVPGHRQGLSDATAASGSVRSLVRSAALVLAVLVAVVLVWLLVQAGVAAWNNAGQVEATDGTPAWPLRSMLLAFAMFTTILAGYGAYRALGRRNKG